METQQIEIPKPPDINLIKQTENTENNTDFLIYEGQQPSSEVNQKETEIKESNTKEKEEEKKEEKKIPNRVEDFRNFMEIPFKLLKYDTENKEATIAIPKINNKEEGVINPRQIEVKIPLNKFTSKTIFINFQ
ncbi:MAG: hypothetical protein MJ252_27715 [archaeon]|nr:hypothetical protein [archaeon]